MDLESEDYRKAQNADGIGLCLLDTRQEFVLFLSTPPASFCKNEGKVSLHMTKNISSHPRLKKVKNI